MTENFWNGFEKKAFLASMWKKSPHKLNQLARKMALNRVKNTPSVNYYNTKMKDLTRKANKGDILASTLAVNFPGSSIGKGGPHVLKDSMYVAPRKDVKKLLQAAKKRGVDDETLEALRSHTNPEVHANTIHHELDEIAAFNKNPEPRMSHDSHRLNGNKGAGHGGAAVILDESNRVFHAMSPKAQGLMKKDRSGSEAALLKRFGLRYGDEYVQPGTRRYNKLVKNIENHIKKNDHNAEKIFSFLNKPGRKPN